MPFTRRDHLKFGPFKLNARNLAAKSWTVHLTPHISWNSRTRVLHWDLPGNTNWQSEPRAYDWLVRPAVGLMVAGIVLIFVGLPLGAAGVAIIGYGVPLRTVGIGALALVLLVAFLAHRTSGSRRRRR